MGRARIENAIHAAVNECREQRDRPRLEFCTELRQIARYHSFDMATKRYIDHVSPTDETPRDRYEKFGYDCRVPTGEHRYARASENIFVQPLQGETCTVEELAARTVDGWLDSPDHRENLLFEKWTREGIGVHVLEQPNQLGVFVTQNFC